MYTINIIEDRDQVMGYAQYTRVIVCDIDIATVIYVTRNKHQEPSITTIGTIAFPAPLITPAMEWERARRQ